MFLPKLILLCALVLYCSADNQSSDDLLNHEATAQPSGRWNRSNPAAYPLLDKIEHEAAILGKDLTEMEKLLQEDDAGKSHNRLKRAASDISALSFPTNQSIPYIISSGFDESQKRIIHDVIKTVEEHTCISFGEGLDGLKLEFTTNGSCCYSSVGDVRQVEWDHYNKSNQRITLGRNGFRYADLLHETFHALGFKHTHARPDRPDYVELVKEYSHQNNYDIMNPAHFDNYSLPYEYNSILHYSSTIGKHGNETVLIPYDKDYIASVGADHGATFNDWKAVNIRYKCQGKCGTKIDCHNKGYQNSRDCSRCVCPIFYTGQFCEKEVNLLELLPGDTVHVEYQNPESLEKQIVMDFSKFDKKLHVIRVPEGQRIRVTLNKIGSEEPEECLRECFKRAVEIVDGDMTVVGKRFCCSNRTGHSFVSKTNVVGYQAYSQPGSAFYANVTFAIAETTDPGEITIPEGPIDVTGSDETTDPDEITTPEPSVDPDVTTTPEPTADPDVTTTPEPTVDPDVTTTPESSIDPDVTTTPESSIDPDVTTTPESSIDPDVTTTPESSIDPDVTTTPEPTVDPDVTTTPESSIDPDVTTTPESSIDPDVTTTPESSIDPDVTTTPESSIDPDVTTTPEPTVGSDVTTTPESSIDPDVTTTQEPTVEPDVTTTPEPTVDPDVTTTPEPSIDPDVTTTQEPTVEPDVTTTQEPTVDPVTGSDGPTDQDVTTTPEPPIDITITTEAPVDPPHTPIPPTTTPSEESTAVQLIIEIKNLFGQMTEKIKQLAKYLRGE